MSTVPAPSAVAGTSTKRQGVRPGRRTISSFMPGTACASHHCAASRTASSIKPCVRQSRSKCGDFAGMRMYLTGAGTMASSQNWPIVLKICLLLGRDVARRGLGALAEEMALGLLHEVLAGARIGEVEAVLVHQHRLVAQPLLPRFLRDVLPDALAELAGVGREIQPLGLAAELDALHHPCHRKIIRGCGRRGFSPAPRSS